MQHPYVQQAENRQAVVGRSPGRVTPIVVIGDFFELLLFVAYLSDLVPGAAILLGVCFYVCH